MYQTFIGIDIGKDEFCVGIYPSSQASSYRNNKQGFTEFYEAYQAVLKEGLVVLETTGGDELALIYFLQDKQCAVHRANTRKVKYFIRSHGQLGKSDAIDALGLAHYGAERHTSLVLFTENTEKTLLKLVTRRNDLKRMITQEKNRLQAPDQQDLKKSFEAVIASLTQEVTRIDEKIKTICSENTKLTQQKEVLKTIPGIGDVIATQLLALLPELGLADRKQIASLSGLAPHPNESGKKIGYRFTRGGRSQIKPIIFMAAMTAARSHSSLGQFYQRLINAGKKKMVALTALMRKIIVIANARMKDFYTKNISLST